MGPQKRQEALNTLKAVLAARPQALFEFLGRHFNDLPEKAKKKIGGGFYEAPEFLDAVFSSPEILQRIFSRDPVDPSAEAEWPSEKIGATVEPKIAELLAQVNAVPVGGKHGRPYAAVIARLLPACLGPAVMKGRVLKESRVAGGWIDVDVPLRLSAATGLWLVYCLLYSIRKIIVEVKNSGDPAGSSAVGQVLRYMETGTSGRFGLLVSRSGFARGAQKCLAELAKRNEKLILPFSHLDLESLATASARGPIACMDFLNARQLDLLETV